jgi:very-short-patch-repair endonuclease
MSLNKKLELAAIAKSTCRKLRNNPTEGESILWESLRRRQICGKKFLRQYPFYHDITGKETFFVSDFYCHEEKLIIELDGKYHDYRLKQDKERTSILNYLGLRVIRFKNEDVINNLDLVLSEIKKHFRNFQDTH